jgi:hypothetical protein
MAREIRNRILRPATPEEKERHRQIRQQVEEELPELKQWAREVAAKHQGQVPVGTVLTAEEAHVLEAMDDYAAKHALHGRGAVVREALANLLGIDIARR